jgi:hypothetical protein
MTTELTATRTTPALSTKNKAGLVLAGLLAVADVVGVFTIDQGSVPGEAGPPTGVLVFGAILGVVTLAAAGYAWRTGNRVGSRVVAGARILSALGALPAFFVEDVPAGLVAGAGVGVVVTIVAVWLVLSPPKA